MESEIIDILIEWVFGHRRGLLKQVESDDKAIEKLQTLKEQLKTPPKPSIIKEADKPE